MLSYCHIYLHMAFFCFPDIHPECLKLSFVFIANILGFLALQKVLFLYLCSCISR